MGLQDIAERFHNTSKLWSMYWHRINNKRRKENLANFHWRTAITIDTHAHSAKLCVFTWKWNARVLSHKMQVCGGCSCLVSSIQYRFCGLGENGIGGSWPMRKLKHSQFTRQHTRISCKHTQFCRILKCACVSIVIASVDRSDLSASYYLFCDVLGTPWIRAFSVHKVDHVFHRPRSKNQCQILMYNCDLRYLVIKRIFASRMG
jgi:hypothetical protein